jgi:hypothetical protein
LSTKKPWKKLYPAYFAARLDQNICKLGVQDILGKLMFYNNIFLGKLDKNTVPFEEFVPGELVKCEQ